MSTDIILKHSKQAGKQPDAGSLKQGELAINTKDVKAYIKNADGQVVQIAGGGSGADDDRYVKLAGDDVTAQEITGTAGLKTKGLLESEGGLTVSGGPGTFGANITTAGNKYNYFLNNIGTATLDVNGGGTAIGWNYGGGSRRSALVNLINADDFPNSQGGFVFNIGKKDGEQKTVALLNSEGFLGIGDSGAGALGKNVLLAKKNISSTAYEDLIAIHANVTLKGDGLELTDYTGFRSNITLSNEEGTYPLVKNAQHFVCSNASFSEGALSATCYNTGTVALLADPEGLVPSTAYGFYSNISSQTGVLNDGVTPAFNKFNFFSTGTAPSFHKGSHYIGGTTARNTLELWKSTLTEEQLEQLEAGTLVAPANVATPGNGEFARQWYYDQQDAETQAELDAGTLEYPTPFAAATFTDSFALGDSSKINLNSGGLGEFKGGVKVTGGSAAGVEDGLARSTTTLNFIKSSAARMFIGEDKIGIIGALKTTGTETVGLEVDASISEGVTTHSAFKLNAKGSNTTPAKYRGIWASGDGTTGVFDEAIGLYIDDKSIGTDANYGVYSAVTNEGGKTNYNIYAAGTARNYFKGDVTSDGTIDGAFSVRMQTDDPAAFQTTFSIDEEGNQVESQEYIGTKEDLLSIIKDLRARVTALENSGDGGAAVAKATTRKK